ncbi:LuxR family transcriptional regulator [Streptomyces sp. XM4193]|uniref:helix-turn-helix transcriptional regulator n=1 Tax=Streptomyces sp. XM4193 TaxID=2929782 RepID=UPI001FF809CA|nr:TrmB family transcriptional regulator sugar-binding domain-containing protein [Streptomyces sp. XM4193]MCK1795066.1 LuxR family transcriptional regulator [Streptomyces sp. XM4193]
MHRRPGDDLEYALLTVQELIESTMVIHRDRSRQEQLITAVSGSYAKVLTYARELIEQAEDTIDILHSRVPSSSERLEGAGWTERDLLNCAQDSVTTRVLVSPVLAEESFPRQESGKTKPIAVRVVRLPSLQVLIADGSTALVVAGPSAARRASLIKEPEVLQALRMYFESIWNSSLPADEHSIFGDRDRTVLSRQILGALRAGVTDEVAARELTVSVRTYRRYVAEIMALLGANSRFQAGVRAAELGLLPSSSSVPRQPGGPQG